MSKIHTVDSVQKSYIIKTKYKQYKVKAKSYKDALQKYKGSTVKNNIDFIKDENMIFSKDSGGLSLLDADLTGKTVKYNGMTVKVIRKLTEEEKQKRAYINNPNAGDYYEVEATSKVLGTSKFIVWEARLYDSESSSLLDSNKEHYKSSIEEMNKYVRNWDFMSAKERNEVMPGASKAEGLKRLKERIEEYKKNLTEDSLTDSFEYLGRNANRKLSFYKIKDSYVAVDETTNIKTEIDKECIAKALNKNINDIHNGGE
jgi:hypothetical protein